MKQASPIIILVAVVTTSWFAGATRFRGKSTSSDVIQRQDPVHSEAKVEVIEKTSISHEQTNDCMCEMGQFWHWRIKRCIDQGAWGYECGFFPGEHHRFVCKDGLMCHELEKTDVEYHGHEGAKPASCRQCEEDDKCLEGEERQAEECLKEDKVSGEACATVRVTIEATATASATKSHTAKESAEASRDIEGTAEDGGVKVTVTQTISSESTVEHTAEATSKASAQAEAVGEAKKCVSAEEVKKALGFDQDKISRVGATKVVSEGDKMAFDSAYESALKEAQEKSGADAAAAAEAAAAAKAAEDAKLEAEAAAAERAAWEAEAAMSGQVADAISDAHSEARDAASEAAETVANVTGVNPQEPIGEPEQGVAPEPTQGPPPRKIPNKEFKEEWP